MSCKVFAFVFARGGSKGIPNKNLRLLAGQPLVVHSVKSALSLPRVRTCFVSTDSDEIARIAVLNGAEVIRRPSYLAQDDSSEWDAWRHAVNTIGADNFDVFLSVPPTSPMRSVDDLERVLDMVENACKQNSGPDIVMTGVASHRNPWFNMVRRNSDGFVSLVCEPEHVGQRQIYRRQDAPSVYDLTTVAYACRPKYITESESIWSGDVGMLEIPQDRALDIDNEFDFWLATIQMEKRCGEQSD